MLIYWNAFLFTSSLLVFFGKRLKLGKPCFKTISIDIVKTVEVDLVAKISEQAVTLWSLSYKQQKVATPPTLFIDLSNTPHPPRNSEWNEWMCFTARNGLYIHALKNVCGAVASFGLPILQTQGHLLRVRMNFCGICTPHCFLWRRAKASCAAAARTAQDVILDFGEAAADASGGLRKLAGSSSKNAERNCHSLFSQLKLKMPLDVSFLNTESDLRVSYISVRTWLQMLADQNCTHLAAGLRRPDGAREGSIFQEFWKRYEENHSEHPVFERARAGFVRVCTNAYPCFVTVMRVDRKNGSRFWLLTCTVLWAVASNLASRLPLIALTKSSCATLLDIHTLPDTCWQPFLRRITLVHGHGCSIYCFQQWLLIWNLFRKLGSQTPVEFGIGVSV